MFEDVYKGVGIMKKIYYGSIVCGLAFLGIGSQINSVTNVLADEATKTVEPNKNDDTTTENAKETATMGTYDEAIKNYNADLAFLEKSINDINGETTQVPEWKESISKLKEQKITDAVSLYKNVSTLRNLFDDMVNHQFVNITVTNGKTTLTAKTVPMDPNSEVSDITLNDGSKLSLSTDESGLAINSSIVKIVDKDGKDITGSPARVESGALNTEYYAFEEYPNMMMVRDAIPRIQATKPEVTELIEAAKKPDTGISSYLDWMRKNSATASEEEINAKIDDFNGTNFTDLSSLSTYYPTEVEKDETFPGPNGEIYDPSKPEDPNKPTKPTKPTKPSTSHHHSSSSNNQNVKPVDKKTVVSHNTVILTTSKTNVPLYDNNGKLITDRALGKNSMWIADKMMTLGGVKYLHVATDEWVKLEDGLEVESLNENVKTDKLTKLYDSTGKTITNRALGAKTDWYTDSSATINGQKMYRVSTNEWVLASEVDVL